MSHRLFITVLVVSALSLVPWTASAQTAGERCSVGLTAERSDVGGTTLADFDWLEGTWRGEGPGGATAEVHYLAPRAGVLPSIFWLHSGSTVVVLEAITLVEEDDGIVLYVRHFTQTLVPLEAERALAQRLSAREGDRFVFENLYEENPRCSVLERTGPDSFRSWSVLLQDDGTTSDIRVEYRRVGG